MVWVFWRCLLWSFATSIVVCVSAVVAIAAVDYQREVKPLLAAKCYRCHGPLKQEAGLRLDTAAALRKGGEGGAGYMPGKSAESRVIAAVVGGGDIERMPYEAKALSEAEIALLRKWIDEGATAPADEKPADPLDHWSFRPVHRPALSQPRNPAWSRGAIDTLVAVQHDAKNLVPQAEADSTTLLRRAYLDLVGLPPTPAELHAFLSDASPDAYERVVDRLLGSPQHGERWARHWMDVWRYSDWAGWNDGGQIRDSQQHIWRWRDWIVEALNADRPYDRMVVEMLAADEVAPTDESALRATGFLVRNYKMLSRETWMQDVVEHTGKAFLALTVNCARCHDHMYDPITQDDYYRFRAIFEPHQVRIDRVRGELKTTVDGLPRVFDGDPAAKTRLFIRGDERTPDEKRIMTPGIPAVFGGDGFQVAAVKLPMEAYYPDVRQFVLEDTLRPARAELDQARAELLAKTQAAAKAAEDVRNSVAGEKQPPIADTVKAITAAQQAQAALLLAARTVATAEAKIASLAARHAADRARYQSPPPADTATLAAQAAAAEKQAELAAAEEDLLRNEQAIATLTMGDENARKQLPEAEKKLAAARTRIDAARKAAANPGAAFTLFGPAYPAESTGRRTALARWIVRPENPLTPRVAVNHLWLRHFGQALAPATFDFGHNGKPPVNPALLDWLAAELMRPLGDSPIDAKSSESIPDAAWAMKHLHRLIATSSVYRQASTYHAANHAADPDNLALWRWPARRIEAETVRDLVLAVSENLDLTRGGADIDCKLGLSVARRSLYFRHAPEKQMEFLQLFDAAAPTQCYQRTESVMPQQALALANSRLALAAARRLARQMVAADSSMMADGDRFAATAFERVLSRPARPEELTACREFLAEQQQLFAQQKANLTMVAANSADVDKPSADALVRAGENLIHALLNHHDFVTIR